MYSSITDSIEIASARGMVREGCAISPLALSDTSMPVKREERENHCSPMPAEVG